jgi:hypothetical protein
VSSAVGYSDSSFLEEPTKKGFGPELGTGQEYSSASSKPDKSGNPLDQEVISPVKEEGACKSLPSTPNTHYHSENVTKPLTPNEKRTQMPTQIWSTAAQARSFLWFLIMALVEMVAVLYRRVSRRPQEEESENLEPTMDVETSIAPITKRVTNLEAEFSKFTLATKSSTLDPSTERIKALEAELAETKKTMKAVLTKQEELYDVLEQMKECSMLKKMHCWG